jgi:tRNA modification GTPase
MYYDKDTICAISTPVGIGGIAIVRISGNMAIPIIKKMFPSFPEKLQSHKLYYGFIIDNFSGKELDEVLVSVMKAPKSYTREDVVEINCHGGYIIAREVLEVLLKNGCRIAEPGEFTKRAFLNGRIDLSQAEAIQELISAKSKKAYEISEKNLKGFFKDKVNELKDTLSDILSEIESNLDFFDDEDIVNRDELKEKLSEILNRTEKIIKSFHTTKKYFYGINLVIIGPPNAGKSSLLNYILKKERAIISEIPGTTRDTIEEDVFINNIPVRLIDTAGIRDASDEIEAEGVKRAFEKTEEADIVIYLFDISKGLSKTDYEFLEKIKDKDVLIVGNKVDLVKEDKVTETYFSISIKKNINMDMLEKLIFEKITESDKFLEDELVITNIRHFEIFKNFHQKIKTTLETLDFGNPLDMISYDINDALTELGKLTGEVTNEDILDKIFSNFCIGK